ncbi:HNH endonuclease [Pseudomonas berkeleyensis]|uniref:HNH endonuclease n=1 Tax=Pseudomonas berkeleyensis TaxID=2726956 RepID=A0A7G5DTV2_9PSED|nr:HNH endonuclease [Pseudomonas berkeleyensis]QMV65177.1 HNH endonuclease [Pseudomonas berkeleyensis]WSO40650.1 HNH endonuclease [Pseudomonas berkeleyensis]
MPSAPSAVCSAPGCLRLAMPGKTRCEQHQAEADEARAEYRSRQNKDYNARRPKSDSFYWTNRWKRKSEEYRKAHPLCVECERIGLVVEATMVDHIIPYRLRPDLGLVDSNLRALCWQCHNRIGAKVREKDCGVAVRVEPAMPFRLSSPAPRQG